MLIYTRTWIGFPCITTANHADLVGFHWKPRWFELFRFVEEVSIRIDSMHECETLSLLAKALSDRTRLKLLAAIARRQMTASEAADLLGISRSTAIFHADILVGAGLLGSRRVRRRRLFYARVSETQRTLGVLLGRLIPDPTAGYGHV